MDLRRFSSQFPKLPTYAFSWILIALLTLSACQGLGFPITSQPTASPAHPLVPLTFQVHTPNSEDKPVFLEVVDEVTGIAISSQRYPMQPNGDNTYTLKLGFVPGSVVRYRYLIESTIPMVERTVTGQSIRYRLALANAPATIEDQVASWQHPLENVPHGRIEGLVLDAASNTPVSGALVDVAGMQTISAADGSFIFENLPTGKHNLVVLPLESAHKAFQQEVIIAENATTPAQVRLQPVQLVNITFVVQPPPEHIKGLPIRIVGNLRSLGNTFTELEGGMSILASRAPLLSLKDDGTYTLTLRLPAGTDLRYKYTLGDGFWNSEHRSDGAFQVRQLIVPEQDTTISDQIETWRSEKSEQGPLTFYVQVPADTPTDDQISIQFHLYSWTPAIPMWPLGNQQWLYVFYGPMGVLGPVNYRICRNEQCGLADDLATAGTNPTGNPIPEKVEGRVLNYQVSRWASLEEWTYQPSSSETPQPHTNDFIAAAELSPLYTPSMLPHLPTGISAVRSLGANWVFLSPTWSLVTSDPPLLEQDPARDIFATDLSTLITHARKHNLSVALFPRLAPGVDVSTIAQTHLSDAGWWENWLKTYRRFILNFADLAQQNGAQAMILGGPDVAFITPSSAVPLPPSTIEQYWRSLIGEARQHFSGRIAWAISSHGETPIVPPWADEADWLYVLTSPSLSEDPAANLETLTQAYAQFLDDRIAPIYLQTSKPVILGINYPAMDGAARGCAPFTDGCLDFERLIRGEIHNGGPTLDLAEQALVYEAIAAAINQREWVSGVVTRGFQPSVTLTDVSPSVRGKPASLVLSTWFQGWIGQ